jgi:hypothetical protein
MPSTVKQKRDCQYDQIFSNGYGKAVAIPDYQGGIADVFIPDQQE